MSIFQVLDSLLYILFASDDTPTKSEFNLALCLWLKFILIGQGSGLLILEDCLLELLLLVIALSLEQVQKVLIFVLHMALYFSQPVNRVVDVTHIEEELSYSQTYLLPTKVFINLTDSHKVTQALLSVVPR